MLAASEWQPVKLDSTVRRRPPVHTYILAASRHHSRYSGTHLPARKNATIDQRLQLQDLRNFTLPTCRNLRNPRRCP